MRQFTLTAAGVALAALLSSATAMAQAYSDDNKGWNRGGVLKTDTAGQNPMCYRAYGDKKDVFTGPQLVGKSDASTHSWQNFWGPCGGGSAAGPKGQKAAKR